MSGSENIVVSTPKIRLFCTDVDGTLLDNPASAERFKNTWDGLHRGRRPLLVYNSGRRVHDLRALIAAGQLPVADYLIGGSGTEFLESLYNRATDFHERFGEGWDHAAVERVVMAMPRVLNPPAECPHNFRSTWVWPRATNDELERLQRCLADAGLHASVNYRARRYLDVRPARADMGKALAWLCARVNVPLPQVLVAGASADSSGMFQLRDVHRIVIENAGPELLADIVGLPAYLSPLVMADGVLDGLTYFGVINGAAPAGRVINSLAE